MSLPKIIGSPPLARSKAEESNSSRKNTVSRLAFGSSMPITLCPGTTATRTEMADMDRAISSAKPTTRLVLVPGAGSNS